MCVSEGEKNGFSKNVVYVLNDIRKSTTKFEDLILKLVKLIFIRHMKHEWMIFMPFMMFLCFKNFFFSFRENCMFFSVAHSLKL